MDAMPRQFPALDALQPAFRHTWRQLFKPFRLGLWARLALVYVSSVFRFVLFDMILTDRHRLIQSWWRWQERGFSYFLWQLAFAATMLVTLLIVVGVPALAAALAGGFESQRPSLPVMIVLGMWLVLSLMAVVVAALAVWILSRDFVVPIMALEEVGVLEGWNRLLPMLSAEKLNYLVYLIIRTVLAVVGLFFFGILALITVIVLLLMFGGVGLTLFLAGLWAEWTWNLYTIILAVVLGGAALIIMTYTIAFLCTPAVAFFPTYAAHFLGLGYPRLSEALGNHPVLETPSGT